MHPTQPFTSWLQDGADVLQCLMTDILSGRIYETDLPENVRSELQAVCMDLVSNDKGIRARIAEQQAEAHFARNPDPYAGLRHSQYERL